MSVIGGVDWVVVQKAMQNWLVSCTELAATQVVWGQQDAPRPTGLPQGAITARVSNIAEVGQPWVDYEDNPLTFADKVVTVVDASADTLTIPGHGLLTADGPVRFSSTGTFPGGIEVDTDYWVVVVDNNTVKLADSYVHSGGGQGSTNPVTTVDFTSAGTGVLTLTATPDTLRAGQETLAIARGYLRVTLELRAHGGTPTGMDMAMAVLNRIKMRRVLPTQRAILKAAKIAAFEVERIRAILGIRDALLFEPRAYMDVHFCVPVEEPQTLTIIERAEIQNLLNGKTSTVEFT